MKKNEIADLNGMASVGKVRDSHGLKGELFVVTNLDEPPSWMDKVKTFCLQFKNPTEEGVHTTKAFNFTVKKIRAHKKGFIVTSAEITNRNDSDLYKGALFYIDESFLTSKKGEKVFLKEVKGFEVVDGDLALGKVIEFSTNNIQDLLVVEYKEQKIEIPFVEEFIEKIDWDNQKIFMKLPQGLYE